MILAVAGLEKKQLGRVRRALGEVSCRLAHIDINNSRFVVPRDAVAVLVVRHFCRHRVMERLTALGANIVCVDGGASSVVLKVKKMMNVRERKG